MEGYSTLPEKTFEQLENFVLSNRTKETDALELSSISAKKGLGKVITAKNYVGRYINERWHNNRNITENILEDII